MTGKTAGTALSKLIHGTYVQWTGTNIEEVREFAGDEFLATAPGDARGPELIIRFRDIRYIQRMSPGSYLIIYDGDDHVRVTSEDLFAGLFKVTEGVPGRVVTRQLQVTFTQWTGENLAEVRDFAGQDYLAVVGAGTPETEVILRYTPSGYLQRVHRTWYLVRNDVTKLTVSSYAGFHGTYDVLGQVNSHWEDELREAGPWAFTNEAREVPS